MTDSSGMPLWSGDVVHWKDHQTWYPILSRWLNSYLRAGAAEKLAKRKPLNLYDDDSEWLSVLEKYLSVEVDVLADILADDLESAMLRVYHGCRVEDAGVFARDGLKRNDPKELKARAREIVMSEEDLAWMRPTIDDRLAAFEHADRDTNRLYVVADDRPMIDYYPHYCIYGSEWLLVFFGPGGHSALRRRGVPTVLEIDLPLIMVPLSQRKEFALALLQEWTRVTINKPRDSHAMDFSFCLRAPIPGDYVVGHYHPAVLVDQHAGNVRRISPLTECPSCQKAAMSPA